jgi:hypothetical protein
MGNDSEIAHVEESNSQLDVDTIDYASPEIQKDIRVLNDPEWIKAQKSFLRKLDFIILPTISALYFFEYLDRGNIAVSLIRRSRDWNRQLRVQRTQSF